MAEVQNLATSTVATDIPIGCDASSGVTIAASKENSVNDVNVAVELGTSPTQERSSISLLHDSEYDTASDLEGGEEYDDDDDDDEDDLDDEEDDITDEGDEEDDDNIEDDDDIERPTGIEAGSQEKVSEAEVQKKVDEDRSNPQYIPKRGTFYEHDDRMADGENDGVLAIGDAPGMEGNVGNAGPNGKANSQTPIISHASKTMKKWQAATGDDCWKHDRFDAGEQQPKSRTELISSYGYDIRSEDAPPRARRRRRYARGPTKYSRKWEDENAYIKASNKERKPPRPSDFPALNERGPRRPRKEPRDRDDDLRDEKENRPERRRTGGNLIKSSVNERLNIAAGRPSQADERHEREDIRPRSAGKSRQNSGQSSGVARQAAMEFKQKSRNVKHSVQHGNNAQSNGRYDDRFERQGQRSSHNQSGNYSTPQNQNSSINDQHQQRSSMRNSSSPTVHMKQQPHNQGDIFNNNNQSGGPIKQHEQRGFQAHHQMQLSAAQQQSQQQQGMAQLRQSVPLKGTPPPSNLSQRLQQVQNRNDPSHVGSVQMHALASQNQQHQQLVMGQQPNSNTMLISSVGQQQVIQQQTPPQEQRGPPKRYSSMRRSQHDTPHIAETHPHQQQQQQLQHMHMQQPPPQQTQQAPQLIMQDQHGILQANLIQLYHQENLQAQMQALQVSQTGPAPQGKQTPYAPVPVPPSAAQTGPPQAYGANPTNTAYYVTDAYGAAAPNPSTSTQAAQYAPQQPAYLAPAQAYANQPQPAATALPGGPPPAVYGGPGTAGTPAAPNANQNYSNYQNYNTVGGTTYFVPPAQTSTRPVVLPQRRPTNAIPILPPAEKNKQRSNESNSAKEDSSKTSSSAAIGSAENIDHILDNMFVQRPAFQPPQAAMTTTPSNSENTVTDTQTQTQPTGGLDETNLTSNNSVSVATESGINSATANVEGLSSGNIVESSNNSVPSATQE